MLLKTINALVLQHFPSQKESIENYPVIRVICAVTKSVFKDSNIVKWKHIHNAVDFMVVITPICIFPFRSALPKQNT